MQTLLASGYAGIVLEVIALAAQLEEKFGFRVPHRIIFSSVMEISPAIGLYGAGSLCSWFLAMHSRTWISSGSPPLDVH